MDEAFGIAIGLAGGAVILGLFFVASRIEALRSRMESRFDRLEGSSAERR
jgi:hypothetical protein